MNEERFIDAKRQFDCVSYRPAAGAERTPVLMTSSHLHLPAIVAPTINNHQTRFGRWRSALKQRDLKFRDWSVMCGWMRCEYDIMSKRRYDFSIITTPSSQSLLAQCREKKKKGLTHYRTSLSLLFSADHQTVSRIFNFFRKGRPTTM